MINTEHFLLASTHNNLEDGPLPRGTRSIMYELSLSLEISCLVTEIGVGIYITLCAVILHHCHVLTLDCVVLIRVTN